MPRGCAKWLALLAVAGAVAACGFAAWANTLSRPGALDGASIATMTLAGIVEGFESRRLTSAHLNQLAADGGLVGKTAVVTGANRGLGRAIATHLAALGAHVIVACRHTDQRIADGIALDAGRSPLRAMLPPPVAAQSPRVSLHYLDLSSLASATRSADALRAMAEDQPPDLVITNAAVVPAANSTTSDGYELMFQVNYLAHALWLRRLLALQLSQPDARVTWPKRVILVVSEAHRAAAAINDRPLKEVRAYGATDSMSEYARSKLALVMLGQELSRRLPSAHVSTICPGPVNSDIARHSPAVIRPLIRAFMQGLFASPAAAAQAVVVAATQAVEPSGAHFHMAFPTPPRPDACDPIATAWLWRETEALLAQRL